MREAARLAAEGVLDVERLVTHRFPLAALGEAFEAARTRPAGFVKAWVAP
jgi:threonine dehydrogenase-like Zn-dependent dehydrogenase